jgi:hypothetical protein
MERKAIEALTLHQAGTMDVSTGKPNRFVVEKLPEHLHAEITRSQFGYQFVLRRDGDQTKYTGPRFASAEAAFSELKSLLSWDPVGRV